MVTGVVDNGRALERGAWAVMAVALLAWPLGMFVPLQDIDEAVYAEVARMMFVNGDFIHTEANHGGWYGHPVLSMWVVAAAYAVGGIHAWVGRVPALLEAVLLAWMTYRLGVLARGPRVGLVAAALWLAFPAVSLMGHHVKTDLNLISLTTACILCGWHALEHPRWWIPAGVLAGLGMLTKGPIGMGLPGLVVLGAYLLERRPWTQLARGAGFMALGLAAAVLTWAPQTYAMVLRHGRYFLDVQILWSTFKRFSSENLTDDTTPLYFVHTLAWAAAPAVPGVLVSVWRWAGRARTGQWLPARGALVACFILLPFAAMSLSRNKLPHYIFPVLPAVAVLGARGLVAAVDGELPRRLAALVRLGTALLSALGALLAVVMVVACFPPAVGFGWLVAGLVGAVAVCAGCVRLLSAREGASGALLWTPAVSAVLVMAVVNGAGGDAYARYAPGRTIAEVLQRDGAPPGTGTVVLMLHDQKRFSTAYETGVKTEEVHARADLERLLAPGATTYAWVPQEEIPRLQRDGYRLRARAFGLTFPTSRFSIPFARVELRDDLATPCLLVILTRPATGVVTPG